MRLEDDDEPPVAELPCRLDRRPDLRRVMCVIVVHSGSLERAEKLQAAVRAREGLQRGRDVGEWNSDLEGHRGCAGRVLNVVPSGLPQVDPAKLFSIVVDGKGADGLGAISSVLAEAVRDPPRLRLELSSQVVIRAYDGQAVVRQVEDEPFEKIANRAHVPEVVRVVELDVRDDGAARMVERERSIRLVGLRHQPGRLARPRARAVTDQYGRVVAGGDEDVSDHACDRGFSGSARDGDRVGAVDELSQHLGSAQHLQSHRSRCIQLGRALDRSAVDQEVLEQDVLGVVADEDAHAGVLELVAGLRLFQVAAADLVAAGEENAGQRRHTRAAGPHQMDSHLRATSCRIASTRLAASRRPAPAEALAIARSRSSSSPAIVATRPAPVSPASARRTAAPASTIAAAFSSWWPPPKVPGTMIIGRPTAVASAMVPTPARLTIRSARDIRSAMSSVNAIPP